MQVPCQQKFWVALRANISFAHFGDQGMCAWARTLPQYRFRKMDYDCRLGP
jgi:hypothetical protein